MSSTNLSLQPVAPIVVDNGMTMDEILAYSPKPRKGRGLARRHINIALNPEAKNALVEDIVHSNESASYLVYSNGLLLTPEGELANQEDYNLSTEELNRQLKEHSTQTSFDTEYADECIVYVPDKASKQFVFSIPPKITGLVRNECIHIDLLKPRVAPTEPSPLGTYSDDDSGYIPINLSMNEFCK
jgi:uncharacterized FlaG/YvyC family protein